MKFRSKISFFGHVFSVLEVMSVSLEFFVGYFFWFEVVFVKVMFLNLVLLFFVKKTLVSHNLKHYFIKFIFFYSKVFLFWDWLDNFHRFGLNINRINISSLVNDLLILKKELITFLTFFSWKERKIDKSFYLRSLFSSYSSDPGKINGTNCSTNDFRKGVFAFVGS